MYMYFTYSMFCVLLVWFCFCKYVFVSKRRAQTLHKKTNTKIVSLRSLLRFPYVHVVYVRFTKLVLSLRVTTYDLRQITSPIMEVKRYCRTCDYGARIINIAWSQALGSRIFFGFNFINKMCIYNVYYLDTCTCISHILCFVYYLFDFVFVYMFSFPSVERRPYQKKIK
jgi:hypothetical protein